MKINIVLGKNIKYEHWSLQMTFIYYVGTLFPFILFASGKKYVNKITCFVGW